MLNIHLDRIVIIKYLTFFYVCVFIQNDENTFIITVFHDENKSAFKFKADTPEEALR